MSFWSPCRQSYGGMKSKKYEQMERNNVESGKQHTHIITCINGLLVLRVVVQPVANYWSYQILVVEPSKPVVV